MKSSNKSQVDRRNFLKTASTAGVMVMSARTAFGAQANEKLKLGLVGCGGRGPWIGHLFQSNTNTEVVAVHDYFKSRVDAAGEKLHVPEKKRFIGLDGYHELIDSGVDAVAVISPPYFHPEQAVATLAAGKHLYLAKPIAVDVQGCLKIVEAANAVEGELTTLVDFQTRNNEFFREAAKLIHEGKIGTPVCGQTFYHCDRLNMKAKPGDEVARLKNWVFDIPLSGDIIVEQNIHVLDVTQWWLQGPPLAARGTGGRKARVDVGDCWDHFIVTYQWPNEVLMDFSSNQFAPGFSDLCTRLYGTEGTAESHYGGDVWVAGRKGKWPGGRTDQIYNEGAVNNMKDFCASIIEGEYLNNAQESANSTMTSILGRMAAYSGERVTWDDMIAADEKLDPQLDLPADGPLQ